MKIKDGVLIFDGKRLKPTGASIDMKRSRPFWMVLLTVLIIGGVGVMLSAILARALGDLIDQGLVFFVGIAVVLGLDILVYLFMNQPHEILVVDHRGGRMELEGKLDDLHVLHYRISKSTLKRMSRSEEPQDEKGFRRKGRSAGVNIGEQLLSKGDADSVKKSFRKDKRKRMIARICPDCGSTELYYEGGLISGYKYHCKDCDYVGSFIIEKELKFDGIPSKGDSKKD